MWQRASTSSGLYTPRGSRKYLNAAERRRFAKVARRAVHDVRLFCMTLLFSGARISEILALTPAAVDVDSCVVTIITLKRRTSGILRQVPLPRGHILAFNRHFDLRRRQRDPLQSSTRLWSWSRTTAWRRVKDVMKLADVTCTAAMPKGLRHGFGVSATANLVPRHILQRWLGHASPESTEIYCDVVGVEERKIASRTWRGLDGR